MNPSKPEQVFYDSNRSTFSVWTVFSREGPAAARVRYKPAVAAEPTLIELNSLTGGPMGLNLRVPGLRGKVTFDYRAPDSPAAGSQFAFFVIPAQTSPRDPSVPLEIGAVQADDLRNAESPLRARYLIPPSAIDGQWHSQEIAFDFTRIPAAGHAIVAPRVNEGAGLTAPGRLLLRNIVVRLTE